MTANADDRLTLALWEADRHAQVLDEALTAWRLVGETTIAVIENDRALRQLTDQILFRFMKLQDALGERLIPATLQFLAEPYEQWPMRDRLDRLEKVGVVDVEAWLRWRETRNRLAHEYPDAPEVRHAQLLRVIATASELLQAYRTWAAWLRARRTA